MESRYNFREIEKKWRAEWEKNPVNKEDDVKPRFYCLDMFPYPSGVGLHAGHPEGYTATDIVSRMKRMQGYNVLHPMGYDSFGLPAEQYAGLPALVSRHELRDAPEIVQHLLLIPWMSASDLHLPRVGRREHHVGVLRADLPPKKASDTLLASEPLPERLCVYQCPVFSCRFHLLSSFQLASPAPRVV